ncbi:VWA domain-containing protein [Aeoliella sp. ICT_H6.2]|uniref:VWA domain-containing protein n=1 Tax=Aeoliella straminimaris TaxID=2954799 RepID=A0A9X2FHG4_9BACT|nr:vWA domain-containing protein [Aeoliella straminimaris]MCO6044866.1 VWA domain-containing protein [Aeoliella straminimaris]
MLTVDPYIPLALWFPLLLAVLAAIVAYAFVLRKRATKSARRGIVTLMSLAAALPMIMLLNPTWVKELPPPAGKPLLTILVDRSASMATTEGEQTRYRQAVQVANEVADDLESRFELRVRAFDGGSDTIELEQFDGQNLDADATNLATAIEDSLDERPQGQAILLLSDGIHNAGGGANRVRASVEKARAMAAPIYTQTIGGQANVDDLEVSLALPQEMAFAGQTLPVEVTLRQRGRLTDRVTVSLVLDGETIEEQEVALQPDGTAEATLEVQQADAGLYRFEVKVSEHPNEVTTLNNSTTLLVRVVDEPVRVLVLEGKPYWDSKFLLRMLASDQAIDLTSIVRVGDDRFIRREIHNTSAASANTAGEETDTAEGDATATTREQTWDVLDSVDPLFADPDWLDGFQVVVLGRDAEVYLNDNRIEQVKRWLAEEGGAMVCMRGPPASVLSERLGGLMPVRWSPATEQRFRVELTESGQGMAWLPATGGGLQSLPSLATMAHPESPKPLAVVLASAAGSSSATEPVITYQPIGSGRVVVVEGAGMWRWAFLPVEHQDRDDVYGHLWRSLVRWLVSSTGLLPNETRAVRSDKVTFDPTERATATLLVRETQAGEPLEVELSGDALDQPQRFPTSPAGDTPGQFRVVFGQLPEGRYQAKVVGSPGDESGATTAFDVKGNLSERLSIAARPDMMRMIAQGSGGEVIEPGDRAALAAKLQQQLEDNFPTRVERVPAWDRWWVLVCVLGVWAVSWGFRRRAGLV